MSAYHCCLHCFADFLVHAFFHVTQCVIGQNSTSVYWGLFLICPLPQESLRGRPKEIPHNEKLLSLKYEVNQSAHPQKCVSSRLPLDRLNYETSEMGLQRRGILRARAAVILLYRLKAVSQTSAVCTKFVAKILSVLSCMKIIWIPCFCICSELNSMWPLFQSLDYDNIENQLFLEEERRMSHMVIWPNITSTVHIYYH